MPPVDSEGRSDGPVREDGAGALAGIPGYEEAVEIGRGGFAVVFRAWQPAFKRHVAIKLISVLQDRASVERFERECLAVGALSGHPNIVTVYDLGRSADGRPFIVMEYLSGGSLADRLERGQPMRWQEAVGTGVKLAGALEAAHRATVLHRDVKPANVLISRFDEPKLADFGIARIQGRTDTRSGAITASFAHAAPEVISGQRPMVPSDVYSLGSTLFELLAGHAPFYGADDESLLPMLARIAREPAPDLRVAGVPPAVCEVIEAALAKEPSDRPATAAELGRRLRAVQAKLGTSVTPLPLEGEDGSDLPSPPADVADPAMPVENETITVPSAPLTPDVTPNVPRASEPGPDAGPKPVERPPPVLPPPAGRRKKSRAGRKLAVAVAALLAVAVGAFAVFASRSNDGRPKTKAPSRPLFFDDFSDSTSGWKQSDTPQATQGYVNGAWEITPKGRDSAFTDTADAGFPVNLTHLGDVAVEVDATRTAGDTGWFGVMCRVHPTEGRWYLAVMDAAGNFEVGKKGPDSASLDPIWTRTITAEQKPLHHIRLECSGAEGKPVALRLSVDGKLVMTTQDNKDPLSAGAVGLAVVPQQNADITASFDNFSVRPLA